jgi:quinol monooxygenase YgiN
LLKVDVTGVHSSQAYHQAATLESEAECASESVELCPTSYIHWCVIVIVNTTRLTVNPEKHIEFVQTIRRLLGSTRGVKGCRTFCFYLDAVDENSSLLISEWETESDLERYLRSNDSAILRGAIRVLSIRSVDSKALVTSHGRQS